MQPLRTDAEIQSFIASVQVSDEVYEAFQLVSEEKLTVALSKYQSDLQEEVLIDYFAPKLSDDFLIKGMKAKLNLAIKVLPSLLNNFHFVFMFVLNNCPGIKVLIDAGWKPTEQFCRQATEALKEFLECNSTEDPEETLQILEQVKRAEALLCQLKQA